MTDVTDTKAQGPEPRFYSVNRASGGWMQQADPPDSGEWVHRNQHVAALDEIDRLRAPTRPDTIQTVTLTEAEQAARNALADLVRDVLIFANWAGGEGFCPEGIPAPEDFMLRYSDATGDEDWDTFPDRISAAIRALSMPAPTRQEAGWQPIETAPRDELILLWDGENTIGAWIDGDWQPCLEDQQPTHWQPLPAPPQPTEGGE